MDEQQCETLDKAPDAINIPIAELLIAVRDGRSLLLKAAAVGLALGLATALLLRNEYVSTAQLMPPDVQSITAVSTLNALNGSNLLPSSLGSGIMSQRSPGATVIGILSSDTMKNNLITRFDLRREYKVKFYEDARRRLTKKTFLEEDKKTGMVTISVTDHDPIRARDLAQAYIDELNALLNTLNTSSAHREREFLEDRLKSLKAELDNTSIELSHFSSRTGTINPQGQGQALIESAARLQGELVLAQSDLSSLKAAYSSGNVRVRAAQAKVDDLSAALRKMDGAASSPSGEEAPNEGQPYPSLRELPLLGVTYTDLFRRVTTEEAVYETLTKQYELAKVDEAKELPVARVLDAPAIPERKSFPHRILISLGVALLAIILALLFVVMRKYWELMSNETPLKALLNRLRYGKNS